jgi:Excreted virulence factor EspC, type VII ESX diderm
VILRVDPTALAQTARPLGEAVEVIDRLRDTRAELSGLAAGAGSERLRRATESFLDAWTVDLQRAHERGRALAAAVEAAAERYREAEDRLRRGMAAASDGAPT